MTMRAAIVVAGGTGERFGRTGGKQLARVAGTAVVVRSVAAVTAAEAIDTVVLVCHPDHVAEFRSAVEDALGVGALGAVVPGGPTRQRSVAAGLAAVSDSATVIAVHDGARPLVEPAVIDAAVAALEMGGVDGVVIGHPAFDTLKVVDEGHRVVDTPDRSTLWVAQTPQVFAADVLRRAYARAEAEGFEGTDDASLVERIGGTVLMAEGPRWNIKVTLPEDLGVVEALLAERKGAQG
jgi:2-C-methyl-D-erythritol 4-phosphate cytidylyltransferase